MDTKWLFLDMNSFFASVEQQARPELRGRPIAVVPMMAETTCCLAASYPAKKYGIKTGTQVADARWMCPEIVFVEARTEAYVRCHKAITKAVEEIYPIDQVLSIDEMSFRLTGPARNPETALKMGRQMKQLIREKVGECLLCSVGIGPNRFLAKIGSNLQKPDGLTLIQRSDLPGILSPLELRDFPGIGKRMEQRLHRAGIRTTDQMCQLSEAELTRIWGGVLGGRWWHLLRGIDLPDVATQRRTVGHSHVLGPEHRTLAHTRGTLVKMIDKAARRLRGIDYWASKLSVSVSFMGGGQWNASARLGWVQDTSSMLMAFDQMWDPAHIVGKPLKVSIVLYDLKSHRSCALPLFAEQKRQQQASKAMDRINAAFGQGAVYFASMHEQKTAAPDRIAFQSIPEPAFHHPSYR